jgi:RNA polymerase sigma factor (sigma-70 family)
VNHRHRLQTRAKTSGDRWLDAAGRQPLLSAAAEIHLGTLVRQWLDWEPTAAAAPPEVRRRGLRARDRMVASNLRLVAHVVERFARPPQLSFEDALQAGAIGLVRAAELFDPARGYKFSTYAFLWIRQAITAEMDHSGTIRLPSNVAGAMRGANHGSVSPEQLTAAAPAWRGCLSLSQPHPSGNGDDDRCIADIVEGGRLDVEQLGQLEAVTAAWAAVEAVDPDATALLQLHHTDGATMTALGTLEDIGPRRMRSRLEEARDRLGQLEAVRVALAG